MTKKMLIDASHAEETRVVVLDGNRLEDFDVETATRKQIKGNIYLAKVIRVEPSLQAAFVEYGGNRHGFLAFGEIHPDYYQIPVADRKRLLALQAEDAAEDDETNEGDMSLSPATDAAKALDITPIEILAAPPPDEAVMAAPMDEAIAAQSDETPIEEVQSEPDETIQMPETEVNLADANGPEAPPPENLGGDGDDAAEARERRQRQRFLRNYKIQDVIHRRQIMLIQVVKEERGNKGAALTTYLSLAGRFSVLMPNSPTGGGVSRKITSVADRRRLKEAMAALDVPEGMGLIVRTAGANRPKPEITRDCEYLLRLWDDIRERTMDSMAPALIYEEASLIKRTIRDVYTRDVEEILVDGQEGYQAARDFMRMLMPSHARKVQLWTEGQPLFARHQVEAQLDAMLNPTVQLRSGGYIVINQTEALVAIDVNSGRSTRERSIEDTALRTNLEAAEEAAKQLRMRDLAGLIVIDFIDMESRKNNAAVERRMKDSLKNDRARIQLGAISHFGLMELSRQRLRPSLAEASLVMCPHCAGQGHVRSPESAALHILRAIEDEGAKFRAAEISVVLPPEIAFYLFNQKRERLSAIEARYAMRVMFAPDAAMTGTNFRIDKIRTQTASPMAAAPASYGPITSERSTERHQASMATDDALAATDDDEPEDDVPSASDTAPSASDTAEEGERKRRRRRRRGKRRPDGTAPEAALPPRDDSAPSVVSAPVSSDDEQPSEIDLVLAAELGAPAEGDDAPPSREASPRRRRARGGRRRTGKDTDPAPDITGAGPVEPPIDVPVFTDIADIFEAAERVEAEQLRIRQAAKPKTPRKPSVKKTVSPLDLAEMPGPAPEIQAAAPPASAAPVALPVAAPVGAPMAAIAVGAEAPLPEKKRGWWRR
ncbi:MAG: ribonuclease E/G [Acidocella sp.]|nr:ribonuclease E/G [Acidocella sp.]